MSNIKEIANIIDKIDDQIIDVINMITDFRKQHPKINYNYLFFNDAELLGKLDGLRDCLSEHCKFLLKEIGYISRPQLRDLMEGLTGAQEFINHTLGEDKAKNIMDNTKEFINKVTSQEPK